MDQEYKPSEVSVAPTVILFMATLTLIVLLAGGAWWFFGEKGATDWATVRNLLVIALMVWVGLFSVFVLGFLVVRQVVKDKVHLPVASKTAGETKHGQVPFIDVSPQLYQRYGLFWRYKVRILWVIGAQQQVEAIAPGLTRYQWLEGSRSLLLWGGDPITEPDAGAIRALRGLRRSRPLDGIVWAVTAAHSQQATLLDNTLRLLQQQAQQLRWQAPLYLWQVDESHWAQQGRPLQPVGCLLPARCTSAQLATHLQGLLPSLGVQGTAQLIANTAHDYLLRLSQRLRQYGIAQWQRGLAPLLDQAVHAVPLRGMMFSLPQPTPAADSVRHGWVADAPWQGILTDHQARGRSAGLPWQQGVYCTLLAGIGIVALGSLWSFFSNRQQIVAVQAPLAVLQHAGTAEQHLLALRQLTDDLARLQYRAEQGTPWMQRMGLSQNQALLAALWPHYALANQRLMRDNAAAALHQQLSTLVTLPPESAERMALGRKGYDQLKAYLMMARPEKTDVAFLSKMLSDTDIAHSGIPAGLWQSAAPQLWGFYASHLAANPQWRITPDRALVAQVRQVLLRQMGRRNAEGALYQKMLQSVASNYADLSLSQMVGDTDAKALFGTDESVPGMFTRQAWEGQVQKAIDSAANARREEIDWVLSDNQQSVGDSVSPEALAARLTERYFSDFSGAWLSFLNSVRLNPTSSLSDVTDQLTLIGDVRQSPLIALMNTLAYQGQTGARGEALSDSLVRSAKNLLNKDNTPQIDTGSTGPTGPLDSTFGPLLTLMGKGNTDGVMTADSSLSLQTFLTRITRVRLKLQQVANANDPQEMTQILAQTVFQGKSVDLTATQEYGSLIAASLGAEWGSFGQTLFVQPLTQAWETVLQPSAASLNNQWQMAIVNSWNAAFTGRYPFTPQGSDASLPMLGEFIRRDSGRIHQFLAQQLSGVLHKEGNLWVPDKVNSQGLRFNPAFLKAVNQLSQLADILYTNGGMGIRFELQAKPVRNVVETTFNLDGQKLRYFNQIESWQSFSWPAFTDKPGVMLSWTSSNGGAQLFADQQGNWGLLRLLEQAKVTRIDDAATLYRLVLTTDNGTPLTWFLRTELGKGPLALLALRGFTLPAQIFDVPADALALSARSTADAEPEVE